MPLLEQAVNFAKNFRRLVGGRPEWAADREFAYYRVESHHVTGHRERQVEYARRAHTLGLRIVRGMGLLDTDIVGGAAILDVGAGECCLAEALAFACGAREVWATDAVPKQIWAAAERYPNDPVLRFLIGDARHLPFEDGSFDIVVANLVLHHIEPVEPLVRELFRVLRPGGRFCAVEPSPLVGALAHERSSENEAPIAPRKILDALRSVGFSSAASQYFWSRMDTTALGPLSPAYRVMAIKPGAAGPATVRLKHDLAPMALPGLRLDAASEVAPLALEQERHIQAFLASWGK